MKIISEQKRPACPRRAAIRREEMGRGVRGLSSALCLAAIAVCGCGYAGTPPGESGTSGGSSAAIAISISPSTANVPSGGAQVFTSSVSGTSNTSVTWSVNGIAGGNSTVGTIASNGAATAIYTAPSAPPSPATVTVTATSAADSSKFGSASVTITCAATNSISPPSASVALAKRKLSRRRFASRQARHYVGRERNRRRQFGARHDRAERRRHRALYRSGRICRRRIR